MRMRLPDTCNGTGKKLRKAKPKLQSMSVGYRHATKNKQIIVVPYV